VLDPALTVEGTGGKKGVLSIDKIASLW
jgi:hypothetical protein